VLAVGIAPLMVTLPDKEPIDSLEVHCDPGFTENFLSADKLKSQSLLSLYAGPP